MPKSIERFEQLFFARLVLSVIVLIVGWDAQVEIYHQSPLAERMGDGILFIGPVISYGISLLLWFFIARRGSEAAKWIYVVFFALAALGIVIGLTVHVPGAPEPSAIARVSGIVGVLLYAASVWFLFRPDTRVWFNKGVDPTQ